MILNKIIGYVLLVVGLAMIVFTVWQSYSIFMGKISAPIIFKVSSFQAASQKSAEPLDLQGQVQGAVDKQISQVMPPETLPKVFNLVAWSFFAFILIFAGGTIAGIGVKLIKIV